LILCGDTGEHSRVSQRVEEEGRPPPGGDMQIVIS
jgi:hypothetical protein